MAHFEALEQTLRLRLVSGPIGKKNLIWNSLSPIVAGPNSIVYCNSVWYHKGQFLTHPQKKKKFFSGRDSQSDYLYEIYKLPFACNVWLGAKI